MADWSPTLYSRFEDERTRPARDLLAHCAMDDPLAGGEGGAGLRIADLGCGPGNSTALLAERFPQAEIIGFDLSPAMLEAARKRVPGAHFRTGDIGDWQPGERFHLVYSNAALQWVRGHEALLGRLMGHVEPGGLLAAQVPDNLADPSQTAMSEIAAQPPFAAHLAGAGEAREPIAAPERYYDWLAPLSASVDVWHTRYQHPMEDAQAIARWFSSTGLKPFVDPLPDDLAPLFMERYTRAMDAAYQPRADGRRLLSFLRLFFVARKRG